MGCDDQNSWWWLNWTNKKKYKWVLSPSSESERTKWKKKVRKKKSKKQAKEKTLLFSKCIYFVELLNQKWKSGVEIVESIYIYTYKPSTLKLLLYL